MNIEAAMEVIRRPGPMRWFNRAMIRQACDFIIGSEVPPPHIKNKARVIRWAMMEAWQVGE